MCVTRHNDITHETVILVSYTAFHPPSSVASGIGKGVTVSGHGESVILEATLSHRFVSASDANYVLIVTLSMIHSSIIITIFRRSKK